MTSTLIGKRAVVIGAGMGGLTAAGALADCFDQVVVLERDTLPSEPAYRAGTPQARQMGFCSAASAPSAGCTRDSNRISRGREPCRSGPVSTFASNARVTIPSRNAISAGRVTRRPGRRSITPCDSAWKAAQPPRCASAAGSRKCWRRPMERWSRVCAARTIAARARRLRRISLSMPRDAAAPVCTVNLGSGVVVMKSAQDGA